MKWTCFLTVAAAVLGCGILLVADPAGQASPASSPDEKGKTDPPGLTLEAKLILKKDEYKLDPNQSGEEFAKKLKNPAGPGKRPPSPPEVEMVFELTNTGKKTVTVPLGSDASSLDLTLEGPGAVTIGYVQMRTMEYRMGKPTIIEPGKSMTIPIAKLLHGMRGDANASYWTAAGTYTLTASYTAPIEGLGLKEEQRATITAAPVKIKVAEAK
ncbi:MAG: hypothetical protein HZA50_13255 [Planctomycetes bacterium]|nr:hypothetical protein [Planctomycetota bacterium]